MRRVDTLVIGAGPTGLGAAARLQELGADYVVVDAADEVGGAAASVTDRHGFRWDLGGHVIHSHFAEFDEAVAASGVTMRRVERRGRVWMRGRMLPAPLQQHLDELPDDLDPNAPAANLAEWLLNCFGRALYESFFGPHNRKMWTLPPEQLDHSWTSLRGGSTAHNVPALALARDTAALPHAVETFPYPEGGSGALWRGIAAALVDPARLSLGRAVVGLDVDARVAVLADGQELAFEHCVSTAPLPAMLGWAGLGPIAAPLRSSALHAVGIGFRGDPPAVLAEASWLYSPDRDVPWYRATMLSAYDPGNAGPGRWSVLCEVPDFARHPITAAEAAHAVIASLVRLGAARGDVVSMWTRRLAHGYPAPTLGRDAALHEADALLRASGIRSRGRFGGWRYESCNQDYSYVQGRQAVDAALLGDAEDVYWRPELF